MSDFEEKTANFEKWMDINEFKLNKKILLKDLRAENLGRGLLAQEPISKGEVLFTIPVKKLLNPVNFPELSKLFDNADLGSWEKLILTMMYAASSEEWKPYFEVLPEKFSTPIFWDNKDLEKLRGSTLQERIGRAAADEMYDSLAPVLADEAFKSRDTSRETFHRMGSLIMAYAFDVVADDDEDEENVFMSMVPMADMLNGHTKLNNARLEAFDKQKGVLEMVATKDIKPGEQIYNTYGEVSNRELLRRYGYVEKGENDFDIAGISLKTIADAASEVTGIPVTKLEQNIEKFASKYDSEEIIDDEFDIVRPGVPDVELLAFANMIVAKKPSSSAYREALEMAEDEKLSTDARKALQLAIERTLGGYAEPKELKPTEAEAYTEIDDMCAQVISTEKQLLTLALSWLDDDDQAKSKKPRLE